MKNKINSSSTRAGGGARRAGTHGTDERASIDRTPGPAIAGASAFGDGLRNAVEALERAVSAGPYWCYGIRKGAEERLDAGPADIAALNDPAYGRALDLWGRLGEVASEMRRLLGEYEGVMALNATTDSAGGTRGEESPRG